MTTILCRLNRSRVKSTFASISSSASCSFKSWTEVPFRWFLMSFNNSCNRQTYFKHLQFQSKASFVNLSFRFFTVSKAARLQVTNYIKFDKKYRQDSFKTSGWHDKHVCFWWGILTWSWESCVMIRLVNILTMSSGIKKNRFVSARDYLFGVHNEQWSWRIATDWSETDSKIKYIISLQIP